MKQFFTTLSFIFLLAISLSAQLCFDGGQGNMLDLTTGLQVENVVGPFFNAFGGNPTGSTEFGKLDSKAWEFNGCDSIQPFFSTFTENCYSRGPSCDPKKTGIYYCGSNPAMGYGGLMIVGDTNDFNPGYVTLKIRNCTGEDVQFFKIECTTGYLNHSNGQTGVSVSLSLDNSNFSDFYVYDTPFESDDSGKIIPKLAVGIFGFTWGANQDIFLRLNTINRFPNLNGFQDYIFLTDVKVSYTDVACAKLTDFRGEATNIGNIISWETAKEPNTEFFIVQKMNEFEETFSSIGDTIFSKGNELSGSFYEIIDQDIKTGETNYYRLVTVGNAQTRSFSDVIALKNDILVSNDPILNSPKGRYILASPNPATDNLKITTSADSIIIYNVSGKEICSYKIGPEKEIQISLDSFAKGFYFIVDKDNIENNLFL